MNQEFQIERNLLIDEDDLLPGEVIIDKSQYDQYLKLKDYEIDESNIHLVETIEQL